MTSIAADSGTIALANQIKSTHNPRMSKRKQPQKSRRGRKAKDPSQKATHHIGAGVTEAEFERVQQVVKETGKSQSTIIRAAFGLPPATV